MSSSPTPLRLEGKDYLKLVITGHAEVESDDRDEAATFMRDLVTRACDAPVCLDVAITADSVDPTGAVLAGRHNAEQVDHWNGDTTA